ncbi:DUF4421 family protein [Lewinella sp. W8]|uniref:DUF4421 family protein n=1 Tax=Lewinella sp. W8 TaxID=2528208 RepID=UPI0015663F0E|nr:DUF4421 family protein [Lewinella sp. W8]
MLFLGGVFPSLLAAQEAEDAGDYVEAVAARNNVRLGTNWRDYQIRFFTNSEKTLDFRNAGANATLGARYGIANLTLSLPLARIGSLTDTEAKQLALNLDFYQKWGYFGIVAQRISGFEEADEVTGETTYRPDVRMTVVGAYGFRVLNDRFSLRAAFKNSERQIRSQGSTVLALTVENQALRTDGLNLQLRDGTDISVNNFDQQKVGMGLGYGHTWSSPGGWYLTPLAVAGLEFRYNQYTGGDAGTDERRFRVSPRVRGRLAMGYNGIRLFASLRGSFLPGYEVGDRLNARIRNTRMALVVGWRIVHNRKKETE